VSTADILLVEDNAEDAAATMQALRSGNLAGELHWVKDGAEALEYLFCTGRYAGRDRREPPRLVLLDIWMPKVDGIEVLLQRGRTSELNQVPVVVMTSCEEERHVLASYHLGIHGYLAKPVRLDDVADTVSKIGIG
jgi:two-component system response regulator